jgi:uncharacterized protein YndB with AHSA1/START domain
MTAKDADDTADRAMVITRTVDAPGELVWEAWTQPHHIARWWGPDGFRTTIHEMHVEVGGVWRFIMHGPDGTDYPNRIVYREIVKPERLVYDHAEDKPNRRRPDQGDAARAVRHRRRPRRSLQVRRAGGRQPDAGANGAAPAGDEAAGVIASAGSGQP